MQRVQDQDQDPEKGLGKAGKRKKKGTVSVSRILLDQSPPPQKCSIIFNSKLNRWCLLTKYKLQFTSKKMSKRYFFFSSKLSKSVILQNIHCQKVLCKLLSSLLDLNIPSTALAFEIRIIRCARAGPVLDIDTW